MNLNVFNSLKAKLFYSLSFVVVISVCGVMLQSYNSFSKYTQAQDKIETTMLADRTASEIETVFDRWIVSFSRTLSTGMNRQSSIQMFLKQHPEFLAVQLFATNKTKPTAIAQAVSPNIYDARLEGKPSSEVYNTLRENTDKWLEHRLDSAKKQRYFVRNLSRVLKLPVGRLAVRFDISNSSTSLWVVFSFWQESLTTILRDSENVKTLVLDRYMDVFSSTKFSEMTDIEVVHSLNLKMNPLVKRAQAGRRLSGYYAHFSGSKFDNHSGAYARVPRFDGLIVITEKNMVPVLTAISSGAKKIGLWAAFFVLLAGMMSAILITPLRRRVFFAAGVLEQIGVGQFNRGLREDSTDEFGFLEASINQMSFNIQNLVKTTIERGRFGKEEETSELIRSVLFPKEQIKSGPLVISGHHESAPGCKGDIWGRFQISEGVEFVYIADAAGQGMSAVLLTTMIYTTFSSATGILENKTDEPPSPARILEKLNKTIYESFNGSVSMAFFGSVIDSNRGMMTFANAGHPFPFLLPYSEADDNGEEKAMRKNSDSHAIPLTLKGAPLGIEKTASFKEKMVPLYAGDKIFYFTDGLIEGRAPDGRSYGRKMLLEKISTLSEQSASGMKNAVISHALDFYGGKIVHDDVTVVVVEVDKKWQPSDVNGPEAIDKVLNELPTKSSSDKAG